MRFSHWTNVTLIGLLAALTLPVATQGAEPAAKPVKLPAPSEVVIPKLSSDIRFDGRLDEAVWKRAVLLSPLQYNSAKGKPRVRTEVRAWYDDEALYLGWWCEDTDIQATFTQRDSHFWEEEVCEFFVTPGELGRYFELQWNPIGGVFDAVILNELDATGRSKSMKGEWGFTAKGMARGVARDGTVSDSTDKDKSWSVEVRIPFADLGLTQPKKGDFWRGNFFRFNRDTGKPAELLAWSPTHGGSFHEPSRFGYIHFGERRR